MTADELRTAADKAEAAGLKWLALSIKDGAGRFPLLGGGTRLSCVSSFGHRTYHVRIKRARSYLARLAANGTPQRFSTRGE